MAVAISSSVTVTMSSTYSWIKGNVRSPTRFTAIPSASVSALSMETICPASVDAFAEAAAGVWRFIDTHQVDRNNGEWFWRVRADGTVDETEPKVSEWKGPYHTVRMCLEMMRRLDDNGSEETT